MKALSTDAEPGVGEIVVEFSLEQYIHQRNGAVQLRRPLILTVLATILVIAFLLRFANQNWDRGFLFQPDEATISSVASRMSWPGISNYFDTKTSSYNPLNLTEDFPYGTFPLFLGSWIGDLKGETSQVEMALLFRSLAALFDLGTVLLLYLIGRRLFEPLTGLLAALLYALCVLPIQYAHFGTFDLIASSLCLATFYFALRAIDSGSWRDFFPLGVTAGLAVASSLSVAPALLLVALPLLEALRRLDSTTPWRDRLRGLQPTAIRSLVAWAIGLLIIRATFPYAFTGPSIFGLRLDPRWKEDFDFWRAVRHGATDYYPTIHWSGRTSFGTPIEHMTLWGLGPALGITTVLAVAFVLVNLLTRRTWPPCWQLALVGIPIFYLAYVGMSFAQPMRYLLPAYPFLVLLAAAGLTTFGPWLRARWHRRWLAVAPTVVVVTLTALWALAFSSVYSRTDTRIVASEWIYQNVPSGGVILTEHWDTGLPLPVVPDRGPGDYALSQLPLFDPDNPDKLNILVSNLDQAGYIVLASDRLWDAVPQIPERYPMTIAYYDALFDGSLGFERVATFGSQPSLFGLQIDDSRADPSFAFFDHPEVMIFQKTDAYDGAAVQQMLASALDTEIFRLTGPEAGNGAALMSETEQATQYAGGSWTDAWDNGSIVNRHPVIFWYVGMQLLALLAVPLAWRAFAGLPDRGYAASKTLGLLIVSVFSWIIPSYHVMGFSRGVVLVSMGLLGLLSMAAAWTQRRELLSDLRSRWRWIVAAEVVYVVAFGLFVVLRIQNPDIWHPRFSGEKPFELAFFTAVAKSTYFPPYDPWFAGGTINYYYFGWVMYAAVSRLTGIAPAIAFNMALASIGAMIVLNAWFFTASLLTYFAGWIRLKSRWVPIAAGLIGALFFAFTGNLEMARRLGTRQWDERVFEDPTVTMRHFGMPGDV